MVQIVQPKKEPPGSMTRAVVDAIAGAIAGGISRTITSPLDVIKIRFQVQLEPTSTRSWSGFSQQHLSSKYTGILQATRDIINEEGIKGLWRGNVPALLMVMPYTSIQFVLLHKTKSFAAGSTRGDLIKLNPALSFLSGALAGCAATIGSYPFDYLRTVLASQGEPKIYPNLRSALVGTLQSRGVRGLYAGLGPTLIEIVPYAGMQFGSYDTFKRWAMALNSKRRVHGSAEELPEVQLFGCGLAAGITAKVCCHPLDVVKKRFQVEGLKRHPRYGAIVEETAHRNVMDTIKKILKVEGVAGLYKGLYPSLVKAGPASAITFVVYESLSQWLQSPVT